MSPITISISGMTCSHCQRTVENALKKVSGVEEVTVDLEKATATVKGTDIDSGALKASVEEAGYRVES